MPRFCWVRPFTVHADIKRPPESRLGALDRIIPRCLRWLLLVPVLFVVLATQCPETQPSGVWAGSMLHNDGMPRPSATAAADYWPPGSRIGSSPEPGCFAECCALLLLMPLMTMATLLFVGGHAALILPKLWLLKKQRRVISWGRLSLKAQQRSPLKQLWHHHMALAAVPLLMLSLLGLLDPVSGKQFVVSVEEGKVDQVKLAFEERGYAIVAVRHHPPHIVVRLGMEDTGDEDTDVAGAAAAAAADAPAGGALPVSCLTAGDDAGGRPVYQDGADPAVCRLAGSSGVPVFLPNSCPACQQQTGDDAAVLAAAVKEDFEAVQLDIPGLQGVLQEDPVVFLSTRRFRFMRPPAAPVAAAALRQARPEQPLLQQQPGSGCGRATPEQQRRLLDAAGDIVSAAVDVAGGSARLSSEPAPPADGSGDVNSTGSEPGSNTTDPGSTGGGSGGTTVEPDPGGDSNTTEPGDNSTTVDPGPGGDSNSTEPGDNSTTVDPGPGGDSNSTEPGDNSTTVDPGPGGDSNTTEPGDNSTTVDPGPGGDSNTTEPGDNSTTVDPGPGGDSNTTEPGDNSTTVDPGPGGDSNTTEPGDNSTTVDPGPGGDSNTTEPGDNSTTVDPGPGGDSNTTEPGDNSTTVDPGPGGDSNTTEPGDNSTTVDPGPGGDGNATQPGNSTEEPLKASNCSAGPDLIGLDASIDRDSSESATYGLKSVRANNKAFFDMAEKNLDNVIFCIIDSGVDKSNTEFCAKHDTSTCDSSEVSLTGCDPKEGDCAFPWDNDQIGHGTHTTGIIAARSNSKGIVGASAFGARVYHINMFGSATTFYLSDIQDAWSDCLGQLKEAKKSNANAKMVISMSLGSRDSSDVVERSAETLLAKNPDVLMVAAAGNDGKQVLDYPAAYERVLAVGAIDWEDRRASFSNWGQDVLMAPGATILSTIPVGHTPGGYRSQPRLIVYGPDEPPVAGLRDTAGSQAPALSAAAKASISKTISNIAQLKPRSLLGSQRGVIERVPLFDCGQALRPCMGADGKVCLIQRGRGNYCDKAWNCYVGGGVGIIMYNEPGPDQCEPMEGTYTAAGCSDPPPGFGNKEWPITLTIPAAHGQDLQQQLLVAKPGALTVTLNNTQEPLPSPDRPDGFNLDFMSGTSMATPLVAGVAGVLWSNFTNCNASIIRDVLLNNTRPAKDGGDNSQLGKGILDAKAASMWLRANYAECNKQVAPPPPNNPISPSDNGTSTSGLSDKVISAALAVWDNTTNPSATKGRRFYIRARFRPSGKPLRPKKLPGGGPKTSSAPVKPTLKGLPVTVTVTAQAGSKLPQVVSCQALRRKPTDANALTADVPTDASGQVTIWCKMEGEGKVKVDVSVITPNKRKLSSFRNIQVVDYVKKAKAKAAQRKAASTGKQ